MEDWDLSTGNFHLRKLEGYHVLQETT